MSKQRTNRSTSASNYWLSFFEEGKEVAGFGITKESRVSYNRLRELWNHNTITVQELQKRISKSAPNLYEKNTARLPIPRISHVASLGVRNHHYHPGNHRSLRWIYATAKNANRTRGAFGPR